MSENAGAPSANPVFDPSVSDEVLQLSRPGTRWLSTGANGGYTTGPVAYNVCVPEGWGEHDLEQYARQRREEAGFDTDGPTLLTGVSMRHARIATAGPTAVVATAGVSNPAVFERTAERARESPGESSAGTVNIVACVEEDLSPGAHANLVAVIAEAKAAALIDATGFPGTPTDAVIVGCDPAGRSVEFSGSATPVGEATRACVYDAVQESLRSRYAESELPETVEDAEYGVCTGLETTITTPRNDQASRTRENDS